MLTNHQLRELGIVKPAPRVIFTAGFVRLFIAVALTSFVFVMLYGHAHATSMFIDVQTGQRTYIGSTAHGEAMQSCNRIHEAHDRAECFGDIEDNAPVSPFYGHGD